MRLLIIGDGKGDIKLAIDIAKQRNAKVTMVESCDQAINFLNRGNSVDLLFIDICFDIKYLVSLMKKYSINNTAVVAYGVKSSSRDAVNAINAGAKEFLPLPPDKSLIAAIFTAISDDSLSIIGESDALKKVIKIADKIAPSSANVLITGASGTGKEVFARYIHNNSTRKNRLFIALNCAAIPENLLESELFGHEKGAFTGAVHRRIGKFEESSGGTLLLDEISEMDLKLQAKLLRAIQEKEIDRVGGKHPIKVDLRLISTSNRDLVEEIKKGRFREDLYFRLNIIHIELPSLKQRGNDIILLSDYFIKKYVAYNSLKPKFLSKLALEKMLTYPWTGNIRELENVIHRSVLLSEGIEIAADDIDLSDNHNKVVSSQSLLNEKQMICSALNYCLGDINKTAYILGVSISSLKEKLNEYNYQI